MTVLIFIIIDINYIDINSTDYHSPLHSIRILDSRSLIAPDRTSKQDILKCRIHVHGTENKLHDYPPQISLLQAWQNGVNERSVEVTN